MIIVEEGQTSAYTLSEDGKEITLYRMFQRDACLFAASCIMNNIQFEVIIEAREDSKVLTIPTSVYQHLIHTSLPDCKLQRKTTHGVEIFRCDVGDGTDFK